MSLHAPGERLVAGVRCGFCGRFYLVAEGAAVPYCCVTSGVGKPASLLLEHHTPLCVEDCGSRCRCPCHSYRSVAKREKR